MIDLNKAKVLAMHCARESGHILLDNLRKVKITKVKDKQDFCTNVDLKIEKLIIREINRHHPDHSILSEEMGEIDKKPDYLWIIDPIDGTKHFLKNIPMFTVSIALQYKGEIILGVVFNPSTHHMYHAYKSGKAYLNNMRIEVSKTQKLDHAFVYLDISRIHHLPKKDAQKALRRLNSLVTETYRVRALGVGSLGMCYLAQGAYDVYFDLTGETKFVDIAAGSLIVQEAGGFVSDLEGKPINKHTKHFLATNGKLKKKVFGILV